MKSASYILAGGDLNMSRVQKWRGGELRMRLSEQSDHFEVSCVWYKKGIINTRALKDMETKYCEDFFTYREAERAYEKLIEVYIW